MPKHFATDPGRLPLAPDGSISKGSLELARGIGASPIRYVIVRLYEDRAWIKQTNEPTFSEVYRGSWTKNGEKPAD